MAEQEKLPAEIEEQLQGLAGEIYLQLEDKFVELLTTLKATTNSEQTNTPVDLNTHPEYLALTEKLAKLNQQHTEQANAYTQEINKLKAQLANTENQQSELLAGSEKSLNEQSNKIAQLEKTISEQNQALEKAQLALSEEQNKLKIVSDNNIKIEFENTRLTNLLEEKHHALAKQTSESSSNAEAITAQYQQELSQLKDQITGLENELNEQHALYQQAQASYAQEQNTLTDTINELSLENEAQQKTISTLEQALKVEHDNNKTLNQDLEALTTQQTQQTSNFKEKELALNEQISQAENKLAQLSEQHQALENNYQQLQTESAASHNQLEKQLSNTTEQLAQLQNQQQAIEKSYQQEIDKQLKVIEENQAVLKAQTQQNQKLQNNILELEQQVTDLTTEKEQDQAFIINLEKKVQQAYQNITTLQDRFRSKQERQEVDYNKARETIKYLRDENLELHSRLDTEIAALEEKVTEYRLRFEYAQQQLAKD